MRRLVLLGTGTGVGKTYLGAMLVRGWRARGHPAWGLKPIESGVLPGAADSDAERLRAEGPRLAAGLHQIALADPVSPHLAAARSGRELSVALAAAWVTQAESELSTIYDNASHAMSLVETAGGALTPLSAVSTCADLAQALRPAHVLLVAPDALGVLHDVGATLLALAGLGCPVDAVVLTGARPKDDSTGSNRSELGRVVFPRLSRAAPTSRDVFTLPADASEVTDLLDAWSSWR